MGYLVTYGWALWADFEVGVSETIRGYVLVQQLMLITCNSLARYDYLDPVQLVGEIDGIRIISLEKCEFLQKVPGEQGDLLPE